MTKPNAFGICQLLTCCVLCTAMLLHSPVWAQKQYWKLSMKEAELRDVVHEISSILGATVVLDPRVQGRITVISEKELDREGVRQLFYSVLDAHGFSVIDQGDRLLIIPAAEAKTRAGSPGTRVTEAEAFVTRVMVLNGSVAADLAGLLRPLVSSNGYIGPSASANALIITDTAANTRRLVEIVLQLDSGARSGHSMVVLKHGLASDIATIMEQSLDKTEAGAGSRVITDTSTNRLVILGSDTVRKRLSELARSLDAPGSIQQENSRVLRLRHSDAKQLGVLAQRLLRTLCVECKAAYTADPATGARLGLAPGTWPTLYRAQGCKHCQQGYRGRTGIYELVSITPTLAGMIHQGASEPDLAREALKLSCSLFQDGQRLVLEGLTSVDELLRISRED